MAQDEYTDLPDSAPQASDTQVIEEAPAGSGNGSRKWLILAAVVVGLLLLVYLLAVLMTAGGVPRNTSVAGVAIGGMSEQEAITELNNSLGDDAKAPITIIALNQEAVIDPAVVGLEPDFEATVKDATGPVFNPVLLFRHLTGQTVEIPPVVSYDETAMTEQVDNFAQAADQPAVEPNIVMDPTTPTLERGEDGEGVDQPAAISAITGAYLFTTGPVDIPVTTLTPTVSDEEAQRVLDEFAVPAISGPVTMNFASVSEEFTVPAIVDSLSFSAVDATLQPQLNVEVMRDALPELAKAQQPGKNATWDVSSGKPVVVPSSPGRGVTDEDLTGTTLAVLPKTAPADRVASLTIAETQPELTTEEAQALNINEQLSTFTQKFDFAQYRLINVGQAAEYMNGTVLKPGDTYSMNGTIKERTEANGYVAGTYISNGRFQEGLGGGVSIATTATWTAAFFAGLEAVEVHPHTLYISRYQAGLEATVAWGQIDLRFKNNTGNGVLITTESGGTFITVTMWGTRIYDDIKDESSEKYNIKQYPTVNDTSASCQPQGGVIGFTIDVWRVFVKGGQEVEREKFTTRYDPTTRVVCAPAPPPVPTPAPAPEPNPAVVPEAPGGEGT